MSRAGQHNFVLSERPSSGREALQPRARYTLHKTEGYVAMSKPLPFIIPGLVIVVPLLVISLSFGDE